MKSIGVLGTIALLYGSLHLLGAPLEHAQMLAIVLLLVGILSFFLLFQKEKWLLKAAFVVSVLLQTSFLFLNDAHNDIYKYLWEGYGSAQGMNIYESYAWLIYEMHPPESVAGQELWERVNFKKYYTTYPPVPQLVFWLAAKIQPFSQTVLKGILFLFQLGSMMMLWRLFRQHTEQKKWLPVLFLSPLFLWEGMATGHSEVLFVFFLLLSIWLFQQQRFFLAGTALAALIWTKFFPAILIPLFIWHIIWREKAGLFSPRKLWNIFLFGIGGLLMTILVWHPFWPLDFSYLQEALGLYAERWQMSPLFFAFFEKWGSRDIAQQIHFWIPFLILGILMIRKIPLEKAIFLLLTTFLLFSATIFSWYFLWLFPLVPFIWKDRNWRFLLIPIFTEPLQYLFGYIDPEYGFRYADNGARLDQILIFWGPFLLGALVTFGLILKQRFCHRTTH